MDIYEAAEDFKTYLTYCQMAAREGTYPPSAIVRTVFSPRYFNILLQLTKDDQKAITQYMEKIYKQIIPYIASFLPVGVDIEYWTEEYDPNIRIYYEESLLGWINLETYKFEYEEGQDIRIARKVLEDVKQSKIDLQVERMSAIENLDYHNKSGIAMVHGFLNRKKTLEKATKLSSAYDTREESVNQELDYAQNALNAAIEASRYNSAMRDRVIVALRKNLNMREEIIEPEVVPEGDSSNDTNENEEYILY